MMRVWGTEVIICSIYRILFRAFARSESVISLPTVEFYEGASFFYVVFVGLLRACVVARIIDFESFIFFFRFVPFEFVICSLTL